MKYKIGDLVAVEGWLEVMGIRKRGFDGKILYSIKIGDNTIEVPEENLVCKAPEPEEQ